MENSILNIPILSGTFASTSYGPSLSGINLVTQSCSESLSKLLSTKCAEEREQEPVQNKKAPPLGRGLIYFTLDAP